MFIVPATAPARALQLLFQRRNSCRKQICLLLAERCSRKKKMLMKTAELMLFFGSFSIIVEFHRTFAPPALKAFSLRWLCHSHDSDGSRIGVKSTPAPVGRIHFLALHHSLLLIRQEKSKWINCFTITASASLDRYESQQFFSYFLFFHTFLSSFDTHF